MSGSIRAVSDQLAVDLAKFGSLGPGQLIHRAQTQVFGELPLPDLLQAALADEADEAGDPEGEHEPQALVGGERGRQR